MLVCVAASVGVVLLKHEVRWHGKQKGSRRKQERSKRPASARRVRAKKCNRRYFDMAAYKTRQKQRRKMPFGFGFLARSKSVGADTFDASTLSARDEALHEMESKLEAQKAQVASLSAERETLREDYKRVVAENHQLQQDLDAARAGRERFGVRAENEKLRAECASLTSRVDVLTSELATTRTMHADPSSSSAAAPSAAPAATALVRSESDAARRSEEWDFLGGGELEPLLASGALALLDGDWLVRRAAEGKRIERRQDLDPEAFVSLSTLKMTGSCRDGLPIVLMSYPWLSPAHPDPKRDTLNLIARVLKAYIANVGYDVGEKRRWGVFWDFACLHQHPIGGGARTGEEEALFRQGLQARAISTHLPAISTHLPAISPSSRSLSH